MAHSGAQFFQPAPTYGVIGGKGSCDDWDNGPISSEWEDALAKHKVIEKFKKIKTTDQLNQAWREEKAKINELDEKDLDELEEMEDELDERDLLGYRRQRLEELKKQKAKNKFGTVEHISEPQFITEVSQSSEGGKVVICCLFVPTDELSMYALKCLAGVARRHGDVKFVKIIAQECIHNYPDDFCPTILIYKDRNAIGHIKRLELGGYGMTADTLEWDMAKIGCFETDQDENPTKKFAKLKGRKKGEAVRKLAFKREHGLVDEEDSDDLLDL